MKVTAKHIDYLNIALIFVSLTIAYIVPFKLFLIAYALLGPLHYLTEINWLNEKKYFVDTSHIIWIFLVFALLFAFPYFMRMPVFSALSNTESINSLVVFFWDHINMLIVLAIAVSLAVVISKNIYIRMGIIALGVLLSLLFKSIHFFNIWDCT